MNRRHPCHSLQGEQLWLLSLLWWLALIATGVASASEVPSPVAESGEIRAFLQRHWARPLPPQGPPPEGLSELEQSLQPSACGTCHPVQFKDWSTSLHSRAMGPGLMGQLLDMAPQARWQHQACLRCHAPLKEQADGLVAALSERAQSGESTGAPHAETDPRLHEQGLVCAACHVRGYRWYGPPRKDGSVPKPGETYPHGGWSASKAFEDARFCAACHQFPDDGYALNGKLLENTYQEWLASPYPGKGKSCQSCHMPERRHLWRGVHDPEMMKAGVTTEATPPRIREKEVHATLSTTNTGTGHRFPTYVTPQVIMEGYQEDAAGRKLPDTQRRHIIARQLTPDLGQELFDTRLAPGETALLEYRAPLHAEAVALVFQVWVEPDAFYTGLYESFLQGGQARKGADLLREALASSRASAFAFYSSRHLLHTP